MASANWIFRRGRRGAARTASVFGAMAVAASLLAAPAPSTGVPEATTTARAPVGRMADPYVARAAGFDVSFPNCSAPLHRGRRFAVVGASNGRPFTVNPCARVEWRRAVRATRNKPSLYFNTAYAGDYANQVHPTCRRAAGAARVFGARRGRSLELAMRAWEIGCSEFSFAFATRPGDPAMWWADVETGNEWSPNPTFNRFTLDGISHAMRSRVRRGSGIYSTVNMWREITGSRTWAPTPGVAAMWVAGGSCSTSLADAPTWLAQGGLVFGVDADVAC